ncbi:MAG: ArsB/NhaD family transporter [Coriobacteriia bacterium]|nr:ArsB/NhaD family transporter [Coriobacteriia bacterium]
MGALVESIDGLQVILAGVIFVVCYVFIISEKVSRATVAMSGAVLMVMLGIVGLKEAYTVYIHWETIFLLLGMMILVKLAAKSGIFQYLATKVAQSAKGDPKKLLFRLAILTAVGSAFIDLVTMVLLMAPITIAMAHSLKIKPMPFMITMIIAANIGGAATLVGDPPNIMIGTVAGISFNDFLIHLAPLIVIIMTVVAFGLKHYYSKQLKIDPANQDELMKIDASSLLYNKSLAIKSTVVFSLTLLGFVTHQITHFEPATIALIGATLLLVIGAKSSVVEEVLHSAEWVTIFFFAGLFVLVGGLVEVGIIQAAATWMLDVTGGDIALTAMVMLWGAGITSAFLDNIPLVATMIPMIQDMSAQLALSAVDERTLWWSLALGACLGGNGTIIASSANLIVVAISAREGAPISFIDFVKIGIPVTLISLALASIYVLFFFIHLGLA